jgi:hypothetical protein
MTCKERSCLTASSTHCWSCFCAALICGVAGSRGVVGTLAGGIAKGPSKSPTTPKAAVALASGVAGCSASSGGLLRSVLAERPYVPPLDEEPPEEPPEELLRGMAGGGMASASSTSSRLAPVPLSLLLAAPSSADAPRTAKVFSVSSDAVVRCGVRPLEPC